MNISTWLETLNGLGFHTMRALLSLLWQYSILLAAAGLLAFVLRRKRASVRHAVWIIALLAAPLLPLLAWFGSYLNAPQREIPIMPAYSTPPMRAPLPKVEFQTPLPSETLPPSPPMALEAEEESQFSIFAYPWALVLLVYATGLSLFLSLVVSGRLRIERWIGKGAMVTDARVFSAFQTARKHFGLKRRFLLVESNNLQASITIRTFRPVVLLPTGLTRSLSDTDLRAVAIHEMAHIKRNDGLLLTLASFVRAVLFFHPLIWLACRQISLLAEEVADDAVLEATGEALPYAQMLARLAEGLTRRSLSTELAAGILLSKSAFLRRVEAILSDRRDQIRKLSRLALIFTILATIVSLALATALPLGERSPAEASAPAEAEQVQKEGEPGVEFTMWVEKLFWQAGEVLPFKADLSHRGQRQLTRLGPFQLEFDGKLYLDSLDSIEGPQVFRPQRDYRNIAFALDERWKSQETDEPLRLIPGRHSMRLAFRPQPADKTEAKPIRLVTNVVQFKILAPGEEETEEEWFQLAAGGRPGSKYSAKEVAALHREEYGEDLSPAELAKFYAKRALDLSQTGPDRRDRMLLADVTERALAFKQDDLTRLRLYDILGGSCNWRPANFRVLSRRRRIAAEAYFAGLVYALRLGLPEEPPSRADADAYIWPASPEIGRKYPTKEEREKASKSGAKRIRELIMHRQGLTGLIVQIYSGKPDAFNELHTLVLRHIGSEEAARQMVSAAKAYRTNSRTPIPPIIAPHLAERPRTYDTDYVTPFMEIYAVEGAKIEAGFVPDKTEIILGEPVFLTFMAINRSDKPYRFFFGGTSRGSVRDNNFRISATDADGQAVKDPYSYRNFGGPGNNISLGPDETYMKRLYLGHWCAFEKLGIHTVTCERTLRDYGPQPRFPPLSVATSFKLEITPYNREEMGKIIDALGKEVQEGRGQVLYEASLGLAEINDERVIPHLAVSIIKGDYRNQRPAIEGLSQFTSDEAANALLPALKSPDDTVREAAGEALQKIGKTERAPGALLKELKDPSPEVRALAARALGATKAEEALMPLIKAMDDPVPRVQNEAAMALGELGKKEAIPALKGYVKDEDMAMRVAAVKGLRGLDVPLQVEWLTPVIRAGADLRDQNFHEAIRLIRLYGGEAAAPALVSCLNFDDPSPRNSYNMFLILAIEACPGGPKYYYKYHSDPNSDGTPEQIENNRKILEALKAWLEKQPAWGEAVEGMQVRYFASPIFWRVDGYGKMTFDEELASPGGYGYWKVYCPAPDIIDRAEYYGRTGVMIRYVLFKYDQEGNISEIHGYKYGGDPWLRRKLGYDEKGRVAEIAYFERSGKLSSTQRLRYDAEGKKSEAASYDSQGVLQGTWKMKVGDDGRTVELNYYGAEGKLKASSKSKYDGAGRLLEEWHRMEYAGKREEHTTKRKYNDKGWLVEQATYDADGKLEGLEKYKYTEDGRLLERLDRFTPMNRETSTSIEKFQYDEEGRILESVTDSDGRLWEITKYDEFQRRKESIRYDEKGEVRDRFEYEYDEKGRPIKTSRYSPDGSLRKIQTSKYNEFGELTEFILYDEQGKVETKWEYDYDEEGRRIRRRYGPDGTLQEIQEYDEEGRQIRRYFAPDGNLREIRKYDAFLQRLKESIHYDNQGNVSGRWEYDYNEQGRQVERRLYGPDDRLREKWEYEYNEQGRRIKTRHYGPDGKLIEGKATGGEDKGAKVQEEAGVKEKVERPVGYEAVTFGPAIERLVNYDGAGRGHFIDFETGKLFSTPAEIAPRNRKTRRAWIVERGIDAEGQAYDESGGLSCVDLMAIPVSREWWDTLPRMSLEEVLARVRMGSPLLMTATGELPATFAFCTREGGLGVLQIQGFTEDPKGIKICYKMLQQPRKDKAAEPAWGEAVEGIECAVRPIKDAFTTGQDIAVDVLFRNVSQRSITVCVYPDPFWRWVQFEIRDATGWIVARSPIIDGFMRPLEISHFVALAAGETASFRQVIRRSFFGSNFLKPGEYTLRISLNKINRMERLVYGFDEFCQKHDLKPWSGAIESGSTRFVIVPMPEAVWGEKVGLLQCGVAKIEVSGASAIVETELRNTGGEEAPYRFAGAQFEVELDGQRYVHHAWTSQNASGFQVYPGQAIGPFPVALADFVAYQDREEARTALRPLARLRPGEHKVRVTYVGRNGKPRVPAPQMTFTVPPSATEKPHQPLWPEVEKGLKCSVKMVKEQLAFRELPRVSLILTNVSSSPIDVIGPSYRTEGRPPYYSREVIDFPCAQVRIEDADGLAYSQTPDDPRATPIALRIAPGASYSFELPPRRDEPVEPMPILGTLLPGKYTARVTYFVREHEKERFEKKLAYGQEAKELAGKKPDRLWEGVIQSKPVPFEVLEDDSEELRILKSIYAGVGIEDLRLELKVSKTTVRAGETTDLRLRVHNSGERILYLGNDYGLWQKGPRGEWGDFGGLRQGTPRPIKPGNFIDLNTWRFGSGKPLVAGEYEVWVEYRKPESDQVVLKSNVVTITVLGLGKPDEAAWGEAVEGVQVRLCPDKTVWAFGEVPTFKANVRNQGKRQLKVWQTQARCELEFDGKWYRWIGEISLRSSAFGPGRHYEGIHISLDRHWHSKKETKRLQLTPGKHTLRVAFIAQPSGDTMPNPNRAVSNPVEIEILPIPEEPWGKAVEGLQCGLAKVEIVHISALLHLLLANVGPAEQSVIQAPSLFEVELDGERYIHRGWQELDGKHTPLAPGSILGPIYVRLQDYVPFEYRMFVQDMSAPRGPLGHIAPGEHWVRAIYVGPERKQQIASGFVTFKILDAETRRPREAWQPYWDAVDFLTAGGSRDEAAKNFQSLADKFPDSELGKISQELAKLLYEMHKEDIVLQRPKDVSALSEDELIRYYIFKLRDVAERSTTVPGKVTAAPFRRPDNPASALRKVGKPAIPSLIALLRDDRPTRSVDDPLNGGHVLRYGDVALQVIEAIRARQFDTRTHRGAYLTNADSGTQAEIISRVKAWWAENQDKSEAQWLREALSEVGIMLEGAERLIELEGAKSIDFFRERLQKDPENPHLVRLLWKAGGTEILEDIRPYMFHEDLYVRAASYVTLLEAGEPGVVESIIKDLDEVLTVPEEESRVSRSGYYRSLKDCRGALMDCLTWSGQEKGVVAVARLIEHPNKDIAGYAIRSLRYALRYTDRFSPEVQRLVFPYMAPALYDDDLKYDAAYWIIKAAELDIEWPQKKIKEKRDEAVQQVKAWWEKNKHRYPKKEAPNTEQPVGSETEQVEK